MWASVDTADTPIGKLEAAERQLGCAIRLFFDNEDSLSIHTLGYAAFKVLFDLSAKRQEKSDHETMDWLAGLIDVSSTPNFLKHADRDPDATLLNGHAPKAVLATLGLACLLHFQLTGSMTPETVAFQNWMRFVHPHEFDLERDLDDDFGTLQRKCLEFLNRCPWDFRNQSSAKAMLAFYQDNPHLIPAKSG